MTAIDPKNLSAQLTYRAAGNPPSTLPDSAISNCFPGLEFDFRNIWRRLFVGLEMHEADNIVIRGEGDYQRLEGHRLLRVDGQPTVVLAMGPQRPNGSDQLLTTQYSPDGAWTLEWSNAMAKVLDEHVGGTVTGEFTKDPSPLPAGIPDDPSKLIQVELHVRPLFATNEAGQRLAVIDEAAVGPGELTQSLCSPWQNDYRECACYYWAATRPDYVNVEPDIDGSSHGNIWMGKYRQPREYVPDNLRDSRLLTYEELFRDWQGKLRFIVGGKDAPE
jgi:hypothetical protein